MDFFYELKEAAQQAKKQAKGQDHNATFNLCCATFNVYDGEPLQFNITFDWNSFATIKFEERALGKKFAVAVASKHDGSPIDFANAKEFAMDEPLVNLRAAFPHNEYIEQLIVCFNKCHTCAKQYD